MYLFVGNSGGHLASLNASMDCKHIAILFSFINALKSSIHLTAGKFRKPWILK